MAANTNPIFVLAPKTAAVQIVNADGTTKKTLLTAGANGARVRPPADERHDGVPSRRVPRRGLLDRSRAPTLILSTRTAPTHVCQQFSLVRFSLV